MVDAADATFLLSIRRDAALNTSDIAGGSKEKLLPSEFGKQTGYNMTVFKKSINHLLALSALSIVTLCCSPGKNINHQQGGSSFSFFTKDSILIYGEAYKQKNFPAATTIYLFHQAGSNGLGEYGDYIIPKLFGLGYNVVTIDQRSGGSTAHGGTNRTVEKPGDTTKWDYCNVYPDIEGAVEFGTSQGFKNPILIGSSYSGALVLKLALDRSYKIKGVIAFSPARGPAVQQCEMNEQLLKNIGVPVIVYKPEREMANPGSKEHMTMFVNQGKTFRVIPGGVHGASMLVPSRSQANIDSLWTVFISDLRSL